MVRALVTTLNSLPPLPRKKRLSMKLFYYDERLEDPGWNPPHFEDCEDDKICFNEAPTKIPCGSVMTKDHKLNIKVAFVEPQPDSPVSDDDHIAFHGKNEETTVRFIKRSVNTFSVLTDVVSNDCRQRRLRLKSRSRSSSSIKV
eukprot:gb/GECG01007076.1/.p1 GENE.gb/GECG01007076.1/~~gb/GECG01007076.1/.p1  ORF type:complete len:144 (+),score=13.66 gb/GECG01007076.1/:1-432(+)